jgi:hypothetical protein
MLGTHVKYVLPILTIPFWFIGRFRPNSAAESSYLAHAWSLVDVRRCWWVVGHAHHGAHHVGLL